jgi:hypothetical protein
MLIRLIAGAVLFVAGLVSHFLKAPLYVQLPLFLLCYLILAYDVIFSAVRGLFRGQFFGESLLMTISSVGAFAALSKSSCALETVGDATAGNGTATSATGGCYSCGPVNPVRSARVSQCSNCGTTCAGGSTLCPRCGATMTNLN